jgi:hypothetical protein
MNNKKTALICIISFGISFILHICLVFRFFSIYSQTAKIIFSLFDFFIWGFALVFIFSAMQKSINNKKSALICIFGLGIYLIFQLSYHCGFFRFHSLAMANGFFIGYQIFRFLTEGYVFIILFQIIQKMKNSEEVHSTLIIKEKKNGELSPYISMLHGTPKQQWTTFAIVYFAHLAAMLIWMVIKFDIDNKNPLYIGMALGTIIGIPLLFVGAIICNMLSKILVDFTSFRTWCLVGILGGATNVLLLLLTPKSVFTPKTSSSYNYAEIQSGSSHMMWTIAFLFLAYTLLGWTTCGRLVWRRNIKQIIKAICLPYILVCIVFIMALLVMNHMQSSGMR